MAKRQSRRSVDHLKRVTNAPFDPVDDFQEQALPPAFQRSPVYHRTPDDLYDRDIRILFPDTRRPVSRYRHGPRAVNLSPMAPLLSASRRLRRVARVGRSMMRAVTAPKRAVRGIVAREVAKMYQPKYVKVCLQRRARKEVLFARGRAGRGSGGARKRRSWRSTINCGGR